MDGEYKLFVFGSLYLEKTTYLDYFQTGSFNQSNKEFEGKYQLMMGVQTIGFNVSEWNDKSNSFVDYNGFLFKTEIRNGRGKIMDNKNNVVWEGRFKEGKQWDGKGICEWRDEEIDWLFEGNSTFFFCFYLFYR